MPDKTPAAPPAAPEELPAGVQRPLTKAELDVLSGQQATITDEWAPSPPPENAGGKE